MGHLAPSDTSSIRQRFIFRYGRTMDHGEK